jgi:diacylglycerol kinase (ATP)
VLLVVNPGSGRGRGARRGREALRALLRAGLRAELALSTRPGGAIEIARRACERELGALVAVGGDGCVHEVVNGLMQAREQGVLPALAVLPAGSGNDFAAGTGSSRGVGELVETLRRPRRLRIDLGFARLHAEQGELRRVFANTLGLGFEAEVNRQSKRIPWLRGLALYGLAALLALRELEPWPLEIAWETADGRRERASGDFLMATAGNGPRSGGGFRLTPQSRHDDGLLELGTVGPLSRREVARLLPAVRRGAHLDHLAVRIEACRSFELRSPRPFPVHADGEFLHPAARELFVVLEPGVLELLLPPRAHSPGRHGGAAPE